MNITLTGATGFLGTRLIDRLQSDHHQLHILGRRSAPGFAFSQWDSMSGPPPEPSLANADAVIHLAGEPVAQKWTPEIKARIRDSRVTGTRNLVKALTPRTQVLISASAVGLYGSRGDEILTEKSAPGQGFLPEVCLEWEREAHQAEKLGIRVVCVRIGVVLGKGGGALAQMLPPFKAGAGGKLASGKQWMAWVHIDDVVRLIVFALNQPRLRGPLNATAPNPVRNAEFTKILAHQIHRPAFFTIPEIALKTLFGEMAQVLLSSQRVIPEVPLAHGYQFALPTLPVALASIL